MDFAQIEIGKITCSNSCSSCSNFALLCLAKPLHFREACSEHSEFAIGLRRIAELQASYSRLHNLRSKEAVGEEVKVFSPGREEMLIDSSHVTMIRGTLFLCMLSD